MKSIIISESQFSFLAEIAVEKFYEKEEIPSNKIFRRCEESKRKGIQRSPWCRLGFLYTTELTQELKERLMSSVSKLLLVYRKNLDTGILPKIINLALTDKTRTVNDLETISQFLTDTEFNQDGVKKQLLKLGGRGQMPSSEELTDLLKMARHKEYTKFEDSWDGKHFKPFKTALRIDYRCEQKMDDKFFNLIQKIKINNEDVDGFVAAFTSCIGKTMESIKNPIKSDKTLEEDLYMKITKSDGTEDVVKVLDKGYYEVKMFDPLVDSYLSEFFSIFKESKLKNLKEEYLDLYNEIVDKIFVWLKDNGQGYLDKVTDNMKGILFRNGVIVPMEFIKLYWSNMGQKGCKEKRISIRYKLKPIEELGRKKILAYKYNLNDDFVTLVSNFDASLEGLSYKEINCE